MKIVKVVHLKKTYKGKNGKSYPSINYYVQADNGKMIAIRPSFSTGYSMLDMLAEVVKNDD